MPTLYDSFKLRLWKPLSTELYDKCVPDGTCGYQFLYQMHLRGLRKNSPDEFPVLLSSECLGGFRQYLEGLILTHEHSTSHKEAVAKVRTYLAWLDIPSQDRPTFLQPDWLGSEAARILTSPDSPVTFVIYDPTKAFPHLSHECTMGLDVPTYY